MYSRLSRLSRPAGARIIPAMDVPTHAVRRELVERLFPDLRGGGDPDIERYVELRREGSLGRALAVYDGPLRARYPDDASRAILLRLYREGDPRWRELCDRLLDSLGARLEARVRRSLDLLAAPLERADLRDAFRALAVAESLVRALSPGPAAARESGEAALALIERYETFARLLRYREAPTARAAELVREYLAMAKSEAAGEYDFVARSAALEDRRRAARRDYSSSGGRASLSRSATPDFIASSLRLEARRKEAARGRSRYFDLSRIKFSATDRARIEIPDSIKRREDRILAYCWRYWKPALDPTFERSVFLYSKKYGTRHHEILTAIRIGRLKRHTDDEILTALSGIVSSSYSYSVSGDLYLQGAWRKLKARLEAAALAAAEASAFKAAAAKREVRSSVVSSAPKPRTIVSKPAPTPPAPPPLAIPTARQPEPRILQPPAAQAAFQEPAQPAPLPASRLQQQTDALPAPKITQRTALRSAPIARLSTAAPAAPTAPAIPSQPTAQATLSPVRKRNDKLAPRKAAPDPLPEPRSHGGGSISDKIRKLSGKAYDVYKENFLERVRDDIRKILLTKRTRPAKLFDSSANEAEDLVFSFVAAHYDDPFMEWETSQERRGVEALGFDLSSLDPVIEACYRRL